MEVRNFREPKFASIKNASDKIAKFVYCWYPSKNALEKSGIGNVIRTYLELDKVDSVNGSKNLLVHIYMYIIYGSVKDFWNLLDRLLYNNEDIKIFPKNRKLIRLGLLVGVWQNEELGNAKFMITQSPNEFKLIRALIKEVYSGANIS